MILDAHRDMSHEESLRSVKMAVGKITVAECDEEESKTDWATSSFILSGIARTCRRIEDASGRSHGQASQSSSFVEGRISYLRCKVANGTFALNSP